MLESLLQFGEHLVHNALALQGYFGPPRPAAQDVNSQRKLADEVQHEAVRGSVGGLFRTLLQHFRRGVTLQATRQPKAACRRPGVCLVHNGEQGVGIGSLGLVERRHVFLFAQFTVRRKHHPLKRLFQCKGILQQEMKHKKRRWRAMGFGDTVAGGSGNGK